MMDGASSGEIRNPHYTKTVLVTDQEKEGESDQTNIFALGEEGGNESIKGNSSSKNESDFVESASLAISLNQVKQTTVQNSSKCVTDNDSKNVSDTHEADFINCKKDSPTSLPDRHEPPQYAVVNKDKKKPRPPKSYCNQPALPLYTEKKQHSTQKLEYYSAQEIQERSPSPVYAEPIINEKKQQTECLSVETVTKKQDDSAITERSPSPEYAVVDDSTRQSKDYTIGGTREEDEQHYYHSLEGPVDGNRQADTDDNIGHKSRRYTVPESTEEGEQHYYFCLEGPIAGSINGKKVSDSEEQAGPTF